uniref:Putative secreted protein n=1 Tax=Anopheles darlingi TaxID=43151 RepID=A0A2M4DEU8_ANODA
MVAFAVGSLSLRTTMGQQLRAGRMKPKRGKCESKKTPEGTRKMDDCVSTFLNPYYFARFARNEMSS